MHCLPEQLQFCQLHPISLQNLHRNQEWSWINYLIILSLEWLFIISRKQSIWSSASLWVSHTSAPARFGCKLVRRLLSRWILHFLKCLLNFFEALLLVFWFCCKNVHWLHLLDFWRYIHTFGSIAWFFKHACSLSLYTLNGLYARSRSNAATNAISISNNPINYTFSKTHRSVIFNHCWLLLKFGNILFFKSSFDCLFTDFKCSTTFNAYFIEIDALSDL